MTDDLQPPVTARELPPEVGERRAAKAAQEQELDNRWEPHIQEQIAALITEVEGVIEMRRHAADLTDLELDADARWSAIWLLSGRCLSGGRCDSAIDWAGRLALGSRRWDGRSKVRPGGC